MNNEQNEEQNIAGDPSTVETPRKKTMTEAALEANRRNATKSTGPRTPAGKLKAASNSLKHGLYSLRNFDNFIAHHDQALAVATNLIEQFNPVTPNEIYYDVQTNKGDISIENLPQVKKLAETDPKAGVDLAKRIIRDFVEKLNAKHNLNLPPEQKT